MTTDAYHKLTRAVRSELPGIASQMNIRLDDRAVETLIDDVVFAMDQATAACINFQSEGDARSRLANLIATHLRGHAKSTTSACDHERTSVRDIEALDG
ncbi:MAG: hypothetical protein EKK41_13770 [Hyphomicrobiales bacterium]|nr:MAG: hypothetical protein EKK41_13770 [Hyphomicrobiales bacterium]